MKKIVILDGYTLFNTDLSFEALKEYGTVEFYERTPSSLTAERIGDAEIVLTNKTVIDKTVIDACPDLKLISVLATGYNVVDCEYARTKGITVCNVPSYSTPSVVQHTFALLLELCSRTGDHNTSVQSGEWSKSKDFCYWLNPLTELSGKVFGIVGYGSIGKSVAKVAEALGMKVLVNNRTPFPSSVSLEEVLTQSDVVSLHCPLTDQNKKFINKKTLSMMKPTAFLINTARGALIEEEDLKNALNDGIIAGAGLDVLDKEPPTEGNCLIGLKNCIITPHIAWASLDARRRLSAITLRNVSSFIAGQPINVVN